MKKWLLENKKGLIRGIFTLPILSVMIVSISHVVSWYELGNPISWAIFLSIAVEIGAMASLAAGAMKIKGNVWSVFIVVTLIQFIGNIFYEYKTIDINSYAFTQWVELVGPLFELMGTESTDLTGHKRWLALLQGGLLPVISLLSLHFFVKYGENEDEPKQVVKEVIEEFGGDVFGEKKTEIITEEPVKTEKIDDLEVIDEPVVVEEPIIGELVTMEPIEEEVQTGEGEQVAEPKIQREDIKEIKELDNIQTGQTSNANVNVKPAPPVTQNLEDRGFSKKIPNNINGKNKISRFR